MTPQIVIYTDLDGSLLDHHDYSYAPAAVLLRELEADRIPVVLCSSKTRSEMLSLRQQLSNTHPFIIENGAAVLIPQGYFAGQPADTDTQAGYWIKRFVQPRAHWLQLLAELPDHVRVNFTGFSDMDPADIMTLTGLGEADADQAAQREFGEPVQWLGDEEQRSIFISLMEEKGAKILRGGRFMHVSGDCDKGKALDWLNRSYADQPEQKVPVSIAIGDSQNDVAMLEVADYALIIRSPAHLPPELKRSGPTLISNATGPSGWDEGVRNILQTINQ